MQSASPTVILKFSFFFFFSRTPVLPSHTTVSVPSLDCCPALKCPLPSQDLETIDTARAGAERAVAVYQTSLLQAKHKRSSSTKEESILPPRRYGPIPSAMEFGSAQTYTCLSLGLGRYPLWASLRFHRRQVVWMESSTSLTGPERR